MSATQWKRFDVVERLAEGRLTTGEAAKIPEMPQLVGDRQPGIELELADLVDRQHRGPSRQQSTAPSVPDRG